MRSFNDGDRVSYRHRANLRGVVVDYNPDWLTYGVKFDSYMPEHIFKIGPRDLMLIESVGIDETEAFFV